MDFYHSSFQHYYAPGPEKEEEEEEGEEDTDGEDLTGGSEGQQEALEGNGDPLSDRRGHAFQHSGYYDVQQQEEFVHPVPPRGAPPGGFLLPRWSQALEPYTLLPDPTLTQPPPQRASRARVAKGKRTGRPRKKKSNRGKGRSSKGGPGPPPVRALAAGVAADKDDRDRKPVQLAAGERRQVSTPAQRRQVVVPPEEAGPQDPLPSPLKRWLTARPQVEEVLAFKQLATRLSHVERGGARDDDIDEGRGGDACTSTAVAVTIMRSLLATDASLELLEASQIARPVAALRCHRDSPIAAAANQLAEHWARCPSEVLPPRPCPS